MWRGLRAVLLGASCCLLIAGCAADADPSPDPAPDSSSSASPSATQAATGTPSPRPMPGPRTLTVETVPTGAEVEVTGADGKSATGTAPYEVTVPGGEIRIAVSRDGYNKVTRSVQLTEDRDLTLWLDREGQLLATEARWETGAQPKQVAFSPDGGELWTSLLGGRGVRVYDAESGAQLDQVELGEHGAVEVIFTRDGGTAYASQMETASVYEIDTATREVRRRINGRGEWSKVMALSPDERMLYLANWISNDISEIDLDTGEVRRLIPTVTTPRGLYATPDGERLYVAGYEDGELAVIDLLDGDQEVLVRTGGAMRHLVADAEGERLYASDMGSDAVYVVDLDTDEVSRLADVEANPNTIDISPDGRVLFVSCRGRNGPDYYLPGPEWGSVLVLDTTDGRLLDAIVGGNQTTGLDVSADGTRLAYSDFLDNRISVLEVPADDVLTGGDGGRSAQYGAELEK